jgi:hypothetical protein
MIPAIGNIVVYCDRDQKSEALIGGQIFSTGKNYNENFRERNPVLAKVIEGHGEVHKGMWIICNYSTFDWDSQFYLGEDLYSIPVNEEIYAWVDDFGELNPLNGNLLAQREQKKSSFELPDDYKKNYWDRGTLLSHSGKYRSGDEVFWMTKADYEIVYTWNGEEKRAIKVHSNEIVGIIKK